MEKWVGKTAIVTGASAGIGAAIVRDFANYGINVIALARRVDKLTALQKELEAAPGKVTPLECDVSSKESVEAAFKAIEKSFGVVHILINNAGIIRDLEILDDEDDLAALEKIEQVIQTNVTGLVHCTRKAFHLMDKSGDYGIIVNIGSIAGHSVPAMDFKFNVYPGTKHAVRATTEVIRRELIKRKNNKIRVAEVSPGAVTTEIIQAAGFQMPADFDPSALADYPALKDSDVSQAVNFLLMTPYSVNITELIIKPVGERA